MNRFFVGQKVICVNSKPYHAGCSVPPIKQGNYYFINAIKMDSGGCLLIDVGVNEIKDGFDTYICPKCKTVNKKDDCYWFLSFRFAPVEEIPESHEEEVKKLIKESKPIEA